MTSAIRALVILPLLALGGCKTIGDWLQPPRVVISDYCLNDRIIRPSRADTADTIKQVASHNARYRAACIPAEPK